MEASGSSPRSGSAPSAVPGALPRIDYLATGGTIASLRHLGASGVAPQLTAEQLLDAIGGIGDVADLRAAQFRQLPSAALSYDDVLELHTELESRMAAGAAGFVVSQGTDTLEEVAFALDLLWRHPVPIVLTGAMRSASDTGGDGPANLLAAVQVAASPQARGAGVLVVMGGEIHAARYVRKLHASSTAAFGSPLTGPLGWVSEGRATLAVRPGRRNGLPRPVTSPVPAVALVRVGMDDDGRLLSGMERLGYHGLVVEGMGGGHVPPRMAPLLGDLATRLPVVLASRTGGGEVLTGTYEYPGSEIDLLARGLIPAGVLDGLKARVLLALCLAAGCSHEEIASAFAGLR